MKKVLFVEQFSTAPLEFGVWTWLLASSSCVQWMLVYKQTLLLVYKQEKKLQADCSEE